MANYNRLAARRGWYAVSQSPAVFILLMAFSCALAADTVPAGGDVPTEIRAGRYDLVLAGDATWNSAVTIGAAQSGLSIDGAGHTITVANSTISAIRNFSVDNTISITNTTFTLAGGTAGRNDYLFGFASGVSSRLYLDGTTFTGFNRTNDRGGTVLFAYENGADIRIDGGTNGVTFDGNRAEWDAGGAMAISYATVNFDNRVTFSNNWTGNYGGAIAVYNYANSLNFNGETLFQGNHASIFGGAIDVWGGAATVVFNGPTTFDGNYIFYVNSGTNTYDSPRHVNDQHVRGGAINIGYIESTGNGASVTFNNTATFTGNYVLSQGQNTNNRNAYGGAVSVYGNGRQEDYRLRFDGAAIFENNWVNATNANGLAHGGAIYYDSAAAELTLSSGTVFRNNYAKSLGGAIYLQSGEINLNATTADITFEGNRHGVQFSGGTTPVDGTGTPNAIYLGSSGSLNLSASAGRTIHFYDPIASIANSTVTVTKSGAGEVIFYGDASGDYDSNIQANTLVSGGVFTLQDDVGYGSANFGSFTVQSGGTVRGGNGSTLRSRALVIQNGGALGGTGGAFLVDSPSITMQSGARFTGSGQIDATSDIGISGTVTADIAAGTLTMQRTLVGTGAVTKTGAGTFELGVAAGYTGATTVSGGTFTAAVANAYQASSSVTVANGGTLDLRGLAQTARNLAGAGAVVLGDGGVLTAVKERDTVFSGSISGDGSLIATGSGTLRLDGASTYAGGTSLTGGGLVAGSVQALGTGQVASAVNTSLVLDIATSGTVVNQFLVDGDMEKTGSGTAILTSGGSRADTLTLTAGGLTFAQTGVFTAGTYTSSTGGTTALAATANLAVTGQFVSNNTSTLEVAIGANDPAITAATANIGGTLRITGLAGTEVERAGALDNYIYTVISTTGGITGDFDELDLGSAASPVDYLTLTGGLENGNMDYVISLGLRWYAARDQASGTFTLVEAGDTFTVDVALDDRDNIISGWNGHDLVKRGAGTLVLAEVNGYSGTTTVEDGTLSLTADGAIANSASVTMSAAATLATNATNQVINNLNGAGAVTGDGAITLANDRATTYAGQITGAASIAKTGTGSIRLSGANTYAGGTSITDGRIIVGRGDTLGSGEVAVNNPGVLQLDFTGDDDIDNTLTGDGGLDKTGAGVARLTADSGIGAVDVQAGGLALASGVTLNASGDYRTRGNAATNLEANALLNVTGGFTQDDGSTLRVAIGGGTGPSVIAGSARIGGTLNVTGLGLSGLARATDLDTYSYTVIETTGGISGAFSTLDLGTAASPVDYLILTGGITNGGLDYAIGLELRWFGDQETGNGVFTLTDASDIFEVDVDLIDRAGSYDSGWTGNTLTKLGDGTLVLGARNTYGGATNIEAGTLSTIIDNAFADSSAVTVATGATLLLNGNGQMARNLAGGGTVNLGAGTAVLGVESLVNTEFSGAITGSGSLEKSGDGTLLLSGANTHDGGSVIAAGRLAVTSPDALGTGSVSMTAPTASLELRFAGDGTVDNGISGTGSLLKTGSGTATLTATGSSAGAVSVSGGGLSFAPNVAFAAGSYATAANATTTLAADATLAVDTTFTQAAGSALVVDIGTTAGPAITAASATIGGSLTVTGIENGDFATATELAATNFEVLYAAGGITGSFATIDFGDPSPVDYITIFGGKSADQTTYSVGTVLTWNAGRARGNGVFTLDATDTFDVDVALTNQNDGFVSRWTGRDLTKRGDGTLTLSAVNGYTGFTAIEGGTLNLTATDAIATSTSVDIGEDGTITLNGGGQTLRNLSGAGSLVMNTNLSANNSIDTTFTGVISGTGALDKQGDALLRLTNENTYQGGTTISGGRLVAAAASALGGGAVAVAAGAELEWNLNSGVTVNNAISGQGALLKTGTGRMTLDSVSSAGSVDVASGALALAGNAQLTTGSYVTRSGATTVSGADSLLTVNGTFTQSAGSTLEVAIGSGNGPSIVADRAELAGTLHVTGLTTIIPASSSDLPSALYRVISTTGGIANDFDFVSLGTELHPYDYITLSGRVTEGRYYDIGFGLTWFAGNEQGNGVFTLGDGEVFEVDDVLDNQTGPFASRWTGQDLYKSGNGTLILAAQNTYTGQTNILEGTLTTAIDNAFQHSSQVNLSEGAFLDLDGHAQVVNNLTGGGTVNLDGAELTAANSGDSIFSGTIDGPGTLVKTGMGQLTLSGANSHDRTSVSQGRLVVTTAGALGQGSATVDAAGSLRLDFSGTETVDNQLLGQGLVEKTGTGTAILTHAASDVGTVTVSAGTLSLEQDGVLRADAYTTASGATTSFAGTAGLEVDGTYTQAAGSTLNITIGSREPVIIANDASIGGTLHVSGFSGPEMAYASAVHQQTFTVIQTQDGITGNFGPVDLGGAVTSADYLTVSAHKTQDGRNYEITSGLTWFAGATDGNGIFTLNENETFTVDLDLYDRTGNFASRWNGRDLTKQGAGTLILAEENSYTGNTLVQQGTLAAGVDNAYQNSANVIVESEGTLALNGYDQIAHNLTGSGSVTLGGATLTVDVDATLRRVVEFSGTISGIGDVVKTGGGTWILSGVNAYSDGTGVAEGRLIITNGQALGAGAATVDDGAVLELAFDTDQIFANRITGGTGTVEKTGDGTAQFTGANSQAGAVDIRDGGASFTQTGAFAAESYTTRTGAVTSLGQTSTLDIGGEFTQEDGATLNVAIGLANNPAIVADAATIGGTLNVTGLAPELTARTLTTTSFTILDTENVIDGDFTVGFGGAMTGVDYLVLAGEKTNGDFDYEVGFGLAWNAGREQGTGSFTMNNPANVFVVDVALNDRDDVAEFDSGWNGRDLTKVGPGTLVLAAVNGYTGDTAILGGVLATGVANAFAASESVYVAAGAELQIRGNDQVANNLSGAGTVALDQAVLTAANDGNTAFSGAISGVGGSVVKTGDGALVLSGVNTYTGGTTVADGILVADGADALGTGEASVAADATLVLHREDDGDNVNSVTGSGTVEKTGAGRTQIGNTFANFEGVTRIQNGALVLGATGADDFRLGGTAVEVAAAGTLAGSGMVDGTVTNEGTIAALNSLPGYEGAGVADLSIGALNNSGDIRLGGSQVGNTLTVRGGMVGSGGRLLINTVLGGDDSPTDRLVLDGGQTTGSTGVLVANRGGSGGEVVQGIKIVDAINGATTADDAFFLSSASPGYRRGVNTLAIGAFDYDLVKGGWGGDPESWYLVSARVLRPETGMYLANREAAVSLFHHSMRDRLDGYEAGVDRVTGRKILGRAWGRIQAAHVRYATDDDAIRTKTKTYLLHTGLDLVSLANESAGLVKAGIMAGLGYASSRSRSHSGTGLSSKGSFDDYSFGVYGTWFQDQDRRRGWYADAWLQYSWQRNKTSGDGLPTEKYDSNVWTGSLEAGYALPVYENDRQSWSVIPAAQAIFSHYSPDDIVEAGGTRIEHDGRNLVTTRMAARLQGYIGRTGRLPSEPYIEANWLHRSRTSRILMDADAVRSGSPRNMVEVKAGLDLDIRRNTKLGLSLFGKFGKNDYRHFGGQIALGVEW